MKMYRILLLSSALLVQIACGTSSTQNAANNAYMSNGVCYQNGQAVSQNYCQNSALTSQVCSGVYYQCNQGLQSGPAGCIQGTCTSNPDTCRGVQNLYVLSGTTQTLQPVSCQ